MRQVYIEEIINKADAADDDYIYSDKVKSGKVLVVKHISLRWSGIGADEETLFFIKDAGRIIYIGESEVLQAAGCTQIKVDIPIGEGDVVGAYNSAITTNDIVKLGVFGELWDLKDWQTKGIKNS